MRIGTADPAIKDAIAVLFQAVLKDLAIDLPESEAGWRSRESTSVAPTIQNRLRDSVVLEADSTGRIRLNLKDGRVRQQLAQVFPLQVAQFEYLVSVQFDRSRVNECEGILDCIVRQIEGVSDCWPHVIALGWWKMLDTSGMPALTDNVLNQGFSPQEWAIGSVRACPSLALSVANRFGSLSEFGYAVEFLGNTVPSAAENISLPQTVSDEDIFKVRRVLRWQQIEDNITLSVARSLGLFWFAFLCLELSVLLPISRECSLALLDRIWSALEHILERSRSEILSELDDLTNGLTNRDITWATEILRFPEEI